MPTAPPIYWVDKITSFLFATWLPTYKVLIRYEGGENLNPLTNLHSFTCYGFWNFLCSTSPLLDFTLPGEQQMELNSISPQKLQV